MRIITLGNLDTLDKNKVYISRSHGFSITLDYIVTSEYENYFLTPLGMASLDVIKDEKKSKYH